jgi:hypothetical protein
MPLVRGVELIRLSDIDWTEVIDQLTSRGWVRLRRAWRPTQFITPHRDPDTAGGVIAVLTIHGAAVFRVWDLEGSVAQAQAQPELAAEWETEDGDLVLL